MNTECTFETGGRYVSATTDDTSLEMKDEPFKWNAKGIDNYKDAFFCTPEDRCIAISDQEDLELVHIDDAMFLSPYFYIPNFPGIRMIQRIF